MQAAALADKQSDTWVGERLEGKELKRVRNSACRSGDSSSAAAAAAVEHLG